MRYPVFKSTTYGYTGPSATSPVTQYGSMTPNANTWSTERDTPGVGGGGSNGLAGTPTAGTGGKGSGLPGMLKKIDPIGLGLSALDTVNNMMNAGKDRWANARSQEAGYANSQMDRTQSQAQAAQTPLGQSQQYLAQNALKSAILPALLKQLGQQSTMPTDPAIRALMPQQQANPLANVDLTRFLELLGNQASLEALSTNQKQRLNIDPNAPIENLYNYGLGDAANPFMQDMQNWQRAQQGQTNTFRANLQKAIDGMGRGK
jgi:hypothetical protein